VPLSAYDALNFLDATCAAFVRGSTVYWYRAPSPDPPLARVRRQPRHRTLPLPYGGHRKVGLISACAMKRCAQCHGKLGLGVRFRNLSTFSTKVASEAQLSEAQMRLIANAVDRSLCTGLSHRFQIALTDQDRVNDGNTCLVISARVAKSSRHGRDR
jgi:hypothetical protein